MLKILAVIAAILLVHKIILTVINVMEAEDSSEKWKQALWLPLDSWALWLMILLQDLKDIFG